MLTVQTLIAKIRANQKLLSISLALHALITDPKSIVPPTYVHMKGIVLSPL